MQPSNESSFLCFLNNSFFSAIPLYFTDCLWPLQRPFVATPPKQVESISIIIIDCCADLKRVWCTKKGTIATVNYKRKTNLYLRWNVPKMLP